MSMGTANAARGKWHGILVAIGFPAECLRDVHGPCPLGCGGKKSWRFDDNLNGQWICTHCGAGDGFKAIQLRDNCDFKVAAYKVDQIVSTIPAMGAAKPERTDEEKRTAITAVWKGSGPVLPDSPAWKYLQNRCGDPGPVLDDLRCHPNLRHSKEAGEHPALVAMMRYPNGKCASLHRTFLTPDGHKAPVDPARKIMPGFPLAASCVRLGPLQEQIGVAEGIETAICAGKRFGLPVWAAISANGMISWEPPEGVRSVVVFGDNDENFTGQQAAFTLAKRLKSDGLDVGVQIPGRPGKDWADVREYLASKFGPEDPLLTCDSHDLY
jgi:putative DNA primase/helicase